MRRTTAGLCALGATALASVVIAVGPAKAYTQISDTCRDSMQPAPAGSSTTGAAYTVGYAVGASVSPAPTPVTPNGGPYVAVEAYDGGTPHGTKSVTVCTSSNAWNDYTHSQAFGGQHKLIVDASRQNVEFWCVNNPKATTVKPTCSAFLDANDPRPATPGAVVGGYVVANGTGDTVGPTGAEAGYVTTPFSMSALVDYLMVDWTPLAPGTAGVTKPCVFVDGAQPAGACGTGNLAKVDLNLYEAVYTQNAPFCVALPNSGCILVDRGPVQVWTGVDSTAPTARATVLDQAVPVDVPRKCLTYC